ncbi:MAG: type II toxin-antitoxin system RelE/ParE family toxin [Reyranellaceae bacterium]
MRYEVRFKAGAQQDIREIVAYLSPISPALAASFMARLLRLQLRLADNPRIYQVTHRGLRCAYLRPFQYGVHYAIEESQVFVLACMHASRDPRALAYILTRRR